MLRRRSPPCPRAPLALAVAIAIWISPAPASACSLAPEPETGGPMGEVGASPLLVAESDAPELSGPSGPVEIEPFVPASELADSRGRDGGPLGFYKPKAPLAPGEYSFDRGRLSFTVTASKTAVVPDLGADPALDLYISGESEPGPMSCGGATSSCGNLRTLVVGLGTASHDPAAPPTFLVALSRPGGAPSRMLVANRFGGGARTELMFCGASGEIDLESALCVQVSGVSFEGDVGPAVDLGCVDPEDEVDRLVRRGDGIGGCNASGHSTGSPALGLMLVLFVILRRR